MSTIGVIITCYNEGPYIEEAVRSVLRQTRADAIARIVIVDDGSDDETLGILRRIEKMDSRIRILYERGNGPAVNRNLASEHIDAEWIAILDGDDIWLPRKLEHQINTVQMRGDIGLVYTGYLTFEDGRPDEATVVNVNDLSRSRDTELDYFRREGPIIPSTAMIRRSVFEAVGKFDTSIRVFEDAEFWARLARVCRFAFVSEPLLKKRTHPGATTSKRASLMAHHAYIAFLIAGRSPRLLPYVPKRLADRARKLGNVEASEGSAEAAMTYYRLAASLAPFDPRAHACLLVLQLGLPLGAVRRWFLARRTARNAGTRAASPSPATRDASHR